MTSPTGSRYGTGSSQILHLSSSRCGSGYFARGAAAEEEFVAAIAERTGHSVDTTFPHLAAALTSAAFRTAMMRWAIDGADRRLSDFVHEAFGLLAAGLAHPAPTTEEVAT